MYFEGEYGYSDFYLGVLVILGGNGIEKIIELEFFVDEKEVLDCFVEFVCNVMKVFV